MLWSWTPVPFTWRTCRTAQSGRSLRSISSSPLPAATPWKPRGRAAPGSHTSRREAEALGIWHPIFRQGNLRELLARRLLFVGGRDERGIAGAQAQQRLQFRLLVQALAFNALLIAF